MVNSKKRFLFDSVVKILLIWCTLQDFILPITYNITSNNTLIILLLYLKDILLLILFMYSIFVNFSFISRCYKSLFLFSIFLFISLLLGVYKTNLSQSIKSFRSLFIIPEFIIVGLSIRNKDGFVNFLKNFFMNYLFILSCLGLLEFFLDKYIGTIDFWKQDVGLTNYFIEIKGEENRLVFGLPGNFYGDYGNGWFSVKRLVSLWASPLTAGYNLLFPAIYYSILFIEKKNIKNLIYFIVFAVSFYLTYTRFNLVMFLLTIAIFFIYKNIKRADIVLLFSIAIVFFSILLIPKVFSKFFDSSTMGHLDAVVNSLHNIYLFGSGLGTFGINSDIGTESAILSCVGQLGVFGFLSLLILICTSYSKLLVIAKNSSFNYSCLSFITIVLLSSFISEQLTAFTSSALPLIILGMSVKPFNDKRNRCLDKNNLLYKENLLE